MYVRLYCRFHNHDSRWNAGAVTTFSSHEPNDVSYISWHLYDINVGHQRHRKYCTRSSIAHRHFTKWNSWRNPETVVIIIIPFLLSRCVIKPFVRFIIILSFFLPIFFFLLSIKFGMPMAELLLFGVRSKPTGEDHRPMWQAFVTIIISLGVVGYSLTQQKS